MWRLLLATPSSLLRNSKPVVELAEIQPKESSTGTPTQSYHPTPDDSLEYYNVKLALFGSTACSSITATLRLRKDPPALAKRLRRHSVPILSTSSLKATLCPDLSTFSSSTKRKWTSSLYHQPPNIGVVPQYEIKRSKRIYKQQLGIEWLLWKAKEAFEVQFASILARWGVAATHYGSCVLLPADWLAVEPIKLLELFDLDNSPPATSIRAVG